MKLPCPFRPHDHAVGLFDSRCRKCKRPLTPSELLKSVKWRIWHLVQIQSLTECGHCEFVSPLSEPACPRCQRARTVRNAFGDAQRRLVNRCRAYLCHSTKAEIRNFQRWLVVASLIGLVGLCQLVIASGVSQKAGSFFGLTIVYVALAGLTAKILIPRQRVWQFFDGTSQLVKLAVMINFLSAFALTGIVLCFFTRLAFMLAALVLVGGASGALLALIAWPLAFEIFYLFLGERNPKFDPTNPQGRTVTED